MEASTPVEFVMAWEARRTLTRITLDDAPELKLNGVKLPFPPEADAWPCTVNMA